MSQEMRGLRHRPRQRPPVSPRILWGSLAEPYGELGRDLAVRRRDDGGTTVSIWARKAAKRTWLGAPALSQMASGGWSASRTAPAGRWKRTAMPVIFAPAPQARQCRQLAV